MLISVKSALTLQRIRYRQIFGHWHQRVDCRPKSGQLSPLEIASVLPIAEGGLCAQMRCELHVPTLSEPSAWVLVGF